jgi:hypothetical protein
MTNPLRLLVSRNYARATGIDCSRQDDACLVHNRKVEYRGIVDRGVGSVKTSRVTNLGLREKPSKCPPLD